MMVNSMTAKIQPGILIINAKIDKSSIFIIPPIRALMVRSQRASHLPVKEGITTYPPSRVVHEFNIEEL